MSGGKKLIRALSESIANGLACLARASLVTVAWISKFVHTVGDGDVVNSIEFSTLIQHLIQCLSSDNTIEERVLASFSLLSLSKSSGTYGTDCLIRSVYETEITDMQVLKENEKLTIKAESKP